MMILVEELRRRHQRRVHRIVGGIVRNADDAEEVTREALLSIVNPA